MLIYSMSVSVDGFIADCDGAFGWTAPSARLASARSRPDPRPCCGGSGRLTARAGLTVVARGSVRAAGNTALPLTDRRRAGAGADQATPPLRRQSAVLRNAEATMIRAITKSHSSKVAADPSEP
jgi:hypothetical protein